MAKKSQMQTAKDWLTILFLLVGLVYFVAGSANHLSEVFSRPLDKGQTGPAPSEITTLFNGASSLALIMFSLLLGFAAIVGWQSLRHDVETIKEKAEDLLDKTEKVNSDNVKRVTDLESSMTKRVTDLESNMKEKNKQIEEEIRGRADAVTGNLIGTLHSVPTNDYQSDADQAYLAEAVHHAQRGYERLKELPGNGKYMALNNLVYYSCLLRLQSKRKELIEQARELRDVGRKYKARPSVAPYLMTYARVMLVYGSDRNDWQEALGTIREVLDMGLTKLSRREAEYIEASLQGKLAA